MAIIKSQIKRIKTNEKSHKKNVFLKSTLKTKIKKIKIAIKNKNKDIIGKLFKDFVSFIDKITILNVIHKNKCNRYKSKISNLIKTIN